MRVLHVTPAFHPATYWGGPIYSVMRLCGALASLPDVSLRVATTNAADRERNLPITDSSPVRFPEGFEVRYFDRKLGDTLSPALLASLRSQVDWCDVVHLTAVYSSPTPVTLLAARLAHKPLVWSPRGSLQHWSNMKKPRMKAAWLAVCSALMDAEKVRIHVTSDAEFESARGLFPAIPIFVVPNAVDHPDLLPARDWRPGGRLRLLFLGRLDPKKGIENLLNSMPLVAHPDVTLTIAGTGPADYLASLRTLIDRIGLADRVAFVGHVEGDRKAELFHSADICVFPSYVENYGLVVAEALGHGVPVITSKGMPWQEVERERCGLWIENDSATLANAVRRMAGQDLPAMGRRGREWIMSHGTWAHVAEEIHGQYSALLQ